MQLWKVGCGTMLLGIVLSLGSCGLFGAAINEKLEQRQIATLDLAVEGPSEAADFDVDDDTRVRIDLEAVLALGESDMGRADSTAAIISTSLPVQFTVETQHGEILQRGAGTLSGSTIVTAATHPSRAGFEEEIRVNTSVAAFEAEGPSRMTLRVDLPATDDAGRVVLSARARVFDRVGSKAGGFALGGLLSMLVGPLVGGAGLLLLILGIILREQKKSNTAA